MERGCEGTTRFPFTIETFYFVTDGGCSFYRWRVPKCDGRDRRMSECRIGVGYTEANRKRIWKIINLNSSLCCALPRLPLSLFIKFN